MWAAEKAASTGLQAQRTLARAVAGTVMAAAVDTFCCDLALLAAHHSHKRWHPATLAAGNTPRQRSSRRCARVQVRSVPVVLLLLLLAARWMPGGNVKQA